MVSTMALVVACQFAPWSRSICDVAIKSTFNSPGKKMKINQIEWVDSFLALTDKLRFVQLQNASLTATTTTIAKNNRHPKEGNLFRIVILPIVHQFDVFSSRKFGFHVLGREHFWNFPKDYKTCRRTISPFGIWIQEIGRIYFFCG